MMKVGSQKDINRLISQLKKERKYFRYPVKNYPPIIMNTSLFRKSDLKWLDFYYSIYSEPDQNFISVPVYLFVETCLNDRMLNYAIKEKNFYNKFLTTIPTPATVLRRINGFYYDANFKKVDKKDVMAFLIKYKK